MSTRPGVTILPDMSSTRVPRAALVPDDVPLPPERDAGEPFEYERPDGGRAVIASQRSEATDRFGDVAVIQPNAAWAEVPSFGAFTTQAGLLLFALVAWTLVLVLGLFIYKIIKNAFWQTSALIRTFIYWVRNTIGNIK